MLVRVPRINNNDDEVKLVEIGVDVGQAVQKGQVVAHVETDKAIVEVESPLNGFVLRIEADAGVMLRVGSVLMRLGERADDPIPESAELADAGGSEPEQTSAPTAKAKLLLRAYGIDPVMVPARGERLSAADVERYVAAHRLLPGSRSNSSDDGSGTDARPEVPGRLVALRRDERGMLATVAWHREVAVPGYIEMRYEQQAWETYAQVFARTHKPPVRPLLPLMASRLVEIAQSMPRLNATIVDKQRYEYSEVNLGCTVQAGDVLYPTVIRNANALGPRELTEAMVKLLRKASRHALSPQETTGATIGFSSMARWHVDRHMPILLPRTAVMVAHTVNESGVGVLGATYDHRVLNGREIVAMLRKLGQPPAQQ